MLVGVPLTTLLGFADYRSSALRLDDEAIFKEMPRLDTSVTTIHTGIESLEHPELIPRSFSPWSDMSSTDSGLEETPAEALDLPSSSCAAAQYEVEQVLDHLTRIAVAIRKSGANFRYQKADRLFDPRAHQDLRSHLDILVLARGSLAGRERWYTDARNITPLQERLIIANLRRRNRFMYAQRHAQKLAIDANEARYDDSASGNNMTHQTQTTILEARVPQHGLHRDQGAPSTMLSATTASFIETRIEKVPRQPPTPSQMAKTNITSTAARVKYPNPPRGRAGMRYFRCPCCCQVLPEIFRQETQWK